ncbi:hypothetical protein SAMN04487774_1313 [Enterococcus faecalis]|uniref:hypothetical protein n=1 Tax=Enterococcus faecalis TaxID=1351 RepID=UPI000883C00F|nr:hypothetical protein [Enterococcus faecalis]SDO12672.1 hypothetical protein SAMN04487774_1313 [Enterococcus faecalis]
MEKEDLKKKYQDSIRIRRIKLNKWERVLEGVALNKNNDKQYISIKKEFSEDKL